MRPARWLLPVLAVLTGCDALRPVKVDNPVMGPPPPRVNLSHAGTSQPRSPRRVAESTERTVLPTAFDGPPADSADSLAGTEVVATVNGAPIFAAEILQRHSDKLQEIKEQVPPERFEQVKDRLIRRDLKGHIEQELLIQALQSTLKPEQRQMLQTQLERSFEDKVQKMMRELGLNTRFELEQELRKRGTSLEGMRQFYTNQQMAMAYLQVEAQPQQTVGRPQLLAYYREHADDYRVPAKVRWQQIVIHYGRHGGKEQAYRDVLQRVIDELTDGADFGDVARRYSDGPLAGEGGRWDWTQKGSLNNERIEKALFELPVGSVSRVIEGDEAFYLVKVNDRRPARRTPFEKVQSEIKARLTRQARENAAEAVIDELYQDAVIETVYD